ncbi:MAG: hypothetical protein ACYT04_69735, partial [Nostoc sp.]
MAEKILHQGVTIEISEIRVQTNLRLKYRLINSQGEEIAFAPQVSVVNYKREHKEHLIEDAHKEIAWLIQAGQIKLP